MHDWLYTIFHPICRNGTDKFTWNIKNQLMKISLALKTSFQFTNSLVKLLIDFGKNNHSCKVEFLSTKSLNLPQYYSMMIISLKPGTYSINNTKQEVLPLPYQMRLKVHQVCNISKEITAAENKHRAHGDVVGSGWRAKLAKY